MTYREIIVTLQENIVDNETSKAGYRKIDENCAVITKAELKEYKRQAVKKFAERVKAHAERCYDWDVAKIVSAEFGNVLDVLLKEYEQ